MKINFQRVRLITAVIGVCILSIIFLYALWPQNHKNEGGIARGLDYADNFYRIGSGKSVASITKYGNGFIGAFYGYLYFFDENKEKIQIISPPEGFSNIDTQRISTEDKKLWDVTGVYYDSESDLLYIANYRGHNIIVCSLNNNGEEISIQIKNEISPNGMMSPENIDVKNGVIAAADYDGNALWILAVNGELINKVDVKLAHGVAMNKDSIFVTSLADRKLFKYNYNGELLAEKGQEAFEGEYAFMWPTGLSVLNDNLVLADAHTGRISFYDFNLNYITSYGGLGPSDNAFNFPYCATAINDCLYVADTFNKRVVVLNDIGQIQKIWGDKVENSELGITYHQIGNIPYTYGITDEVSSQLFNPLIDGNVILGYDSIWLENDGEFTQCPTTDYKCNEGVSDYSQILLNQQYMLWIKRLNLDDKEYYVIGSPQGYWPCYVYNATDNIFFLSVAYGVEYPRLWYVNGKWYGGDTYDTVLERGIHAADNAQHEYISLVNMGMDKREAYARAFWRYYYDIYANINNNVANTVSSKDVLDPQITEYNLLLWLNKNFSTINGMEFWKNYTNDKAQLHRNTMKYFENAKNGGGAHMCEMLMVRMFGQVKED